MPFKQIRYGTPFFTTNVKKILKAFPRIPEFQILNPEEDRVFNNVFTVCFYI